MKYTITGDNLQFVNVQLEQGEEMLSAAGAMRYMSGNMRMEAKMEGGFLKGLKRSISGESFFMLRYHPEGGSGAVGFGGSAPGKIIDLDIGQETCLLNEPCSLADVEIDDLSGCASAESDHS